MTRFIARTLKGAKATPYPGFVPFCHPRLKAKVPTGAGWLYEIKFDGYRSQLHLNAGKAKAYSRNGNDFTRDFAPICAAAERIAAKSSSLTERSSYPMRMAAQTSAHCARRSERIPTGCSFTRSICWTRERHYYVPCDPSANVQT